MPHRLTTIDLRSLAACRIAVGAVVLADLALRFRDMEAMMTDTGMFPRSFMSPAPLQWSLHAAGGGAAWVTLLFAVHALAACLLMAGRWTRPATMVCWLLACSLQVRNPLITNSGDALLRMALFWGMFLPWGRRWSWDARRRPSPATSTGPSWPAAAMLLQLCLVYWVTGALKLNADWLQGAAMSKVAALDFAIRPWGWRLAGDPRLLSVVSMTVPWIELLAPVLLWLPWRNSWWRTVVPLGMIAFHGVIELFLHVGMFGLVSQAYWLVFLPAEFWRRLGVGSQDLIEPGERRSAAGRLAEALAAAALLLVVASSVHGLLEGLQRNTADVESTPQGAGATALPLGWLPPITDTLLIRQQWMMFQRPPELDSWAVARADLIDGRQVDALRDTAYDPRGAPRQAHRLPSQHWRYFFRRLPARSPDLAQRAADYLLQRWNAHHGPEQQASRLTLLEFSEMYGEDGFSTRTLAIARNDEIQFDLEGALRDLELYDHP